MVEDGRKLNVLALTRDLRPASLEPIRYEIEISRVSEEVYAKTRRAVEVAIPGVFIASIRPVSIADLLREDEQRAQRGEPRRFDPDWVNPSETMRATVPPAMEVFIDPRAIRIKDSHWLSTGLQKREIAKVEVRLRERLPEAVRLFVGLHMVDPSTMVQLEDAWIDAGRGLLLPNYFARTSVPTVQGSDAVVGRFGKGRIRLRGVRSSYNNAGEGIVFAVPVGVLPQKLAA